MTIDGEKMSLPDAFKLQLGKLGLGRKEGESIDQWSSRCKAWTNKTPYGKIIKEAT
tara:strand:+ start:920 stop:1087 length:168 start_codon:yes stop_codon:yes gene_type:complete